MAWTQEASGHLYAHICSKVVVLGSEVYHWALVLALL